MPTAVKRRRVTYTNGNGNGNGDLSSYSRFRDRLLLGLATVAIALMGYFVHQSQLQVDNLRSELHELRDRLNGELNSAAAFQSGQTTQGAEVIRRLGILDNKVDTLSSLTSRYIPVPVQPAPGQIYPAPPPSPH